MVKKSNITSFNGFSLVEMLIVILILSIVAAASVPFVQPKKAKKNYIKSPHGIFECYYQNGTLYQYEANNKTNKNGKETIAGDACRITLPPANYYKMQLIGAGGNGSKNPVEYEIITNDDYSTGSVSIKYLSSLPNWVKENWPGIKLNVTMTSPLGDSGKRICTTNLNITKENQDICEGFLGMGWATGFMPPECRLEIKRSGGPSGYGSTYTIKDLAISPNDKINYSGSYSYNNIYFKHNDNTYVLNASGNGGDASDENDGTRGENSTWSSNCEGASINSEYTEIAECFVDLGDNDYRIGSPGTITVDPEIISYSKSDSYITLELGKNGTDAVPIDFAFPNLGGKTLTIKPAKTNSDETTVEIKDYTLAKAQSGTNGSGLEYSKQRYDDIESFDETTSPIGYNPYNLGKITTSDLFNDINDTNLESMIKKHNLRPGVAGVGSYPYISTISYTKQMTINSSPIPEDITVELDTSIKCNDGSEPIEGPGGTYCEGVNGKSGAVRVVW